MVCSCENCFTCWEGSCSLQWRKEQIRFFHTTKTAEDFRKHFYYYEGPKAQPRSQGSKAGKGHAKITPPVFCVRHGLAQPAAYLSVDNGCHPEAFAWPRNRQHGPQEYKDGKHEGYHGGRDHVVKDDHKIAHHFWPGHQRIVQGINKEQDSRLTNIELLWLLQLVIMKHPARSRVPQMNQT